MEHKDTKTIPMQKVCEKISLLLFAVLTLTAGCTGKNPQSTEKSTQPTDTVYTPKTAMAVYGYQPERALQIIDSAVIVGNLSEVRADVERARIYSMTQMKAQMDSVLGGPKGTSLDSGRVIGERLLAHDSLMHDLNLRQQLLEILVYTARMQQDTLKWMQRSRELIDVCRREGAETEALRTEAELGAARCYAGQAEQGMATLDSVIAVLGTMPTFKFNELDAFIIASKRKIGVLSSTGRYVETLPLARRIIERLEDYEAHPDQYADDSKRVPADSASRASYINFYRTQAQGYIPAAYTALGQSDNMTEAYLQIERSVTEMTAREHIARYNALQQQMEAERQQSRADNIRLQAVGIFIIALLAIVFAIILFRKNRDIRQKNRILTQQLTELYDNTRPETIEHSTLNIEHSAAQTRADANNVQSSIFNVQSSMFNVQSSMFNVQSSMFNIQSDSMNPEDLYCHIRDEVNRLQLYTDPGFGRQSIIERFHLTKDQASRVFSQGSEHTSISDFINNCRLDHARRLLVSRPDMSISDIATASGFGVRTTFTRSFKAKHGLTPTEFREQQR